MSEETWNAQIIELRRENKAKDEEITRLKAEAKEAEESIGGQVRVNIKLTEELSKCKAELEPYKKRYELDRIHYMKPFIDRAEKAEAEVGRLKETLELFQRFDGGVSPMELEREP